MSDLENTHADMGTLGILGVSEREERVYRWLLAHPHATVAYVARALGLTSHKARQLLDAIEAKGLVTHTPEHPHRYIPASPDIALEAFAVRRQAELRRARETILELQKQAVAEHSEHDDEHLVELITSTEAEQQVFEQIHRSAQQEVVTLTRPPIRVTRLGKSHAQDLNSQREAQARGVNYRGIIDAAFLAFPGAAHAVREEVEAGQDIRIASDLPFKLVLSDHRIALIPLSLEKKDSPVLLVRSPALLGALSALFETLWKQATPFLSATHGKGISIGSDDRAPPREAEELISLLAAGVNDKSIAYEMGISVSTLSRRIAELMHALSARTRFQLGWLADRQYGAKYPDD